LIDGFRERTSSAQQIGGAGREHAIAYRLEPVHTSILT
jgi:hypothetical protein